MSHLDNSLWPVFIFKFQLCLHFVPRNLILFLISSLETHNIFTLNTFKKFLSFFFTQVIKTRSPFQTFMTLCISKELALYSVIIVFNGVTSGFGTSLIELNAFAES